MKKVIALILNWFSFICATGQSTPVVPLESLNVQSGILNLQGPFDIFSPYQGLGPVMIYNAAQVDFVAGERVHLGPGFSAGSFSGNGYFHAQIGSNPDFDVVYIQPNEGYPQVGINEKLEIGMNLPADLQFAVQSFLATGSGTNPFDPNQINVRADFVNGSEHFVSYGFYYQDYERDVSTLSPFVPYNWIAQPTEYDWRIRFAPRKLGNWTGTISVSLNGATTAMYVVSGLVFECVSSDNPGYLEVGSDNRHLRFSTAGHSFFGIGQNIAWCGPYFRGQVAITQPYLYADGILDLHDWINSLADNGGNLARFIVTPQFGEIEWGELGNYSSPNVSEPQTPLSNTGLTQAWELDRFVELCEQRNVYLILNLVFQGEYREDTPEPFGWQYNPYNQQIPGITRPTELYGIPSVRAEAIRHLNNKHRYYLSRYGYSTSIGVLQMFSEFTNWDYNNLENNAQQREEAFDFLRDIAVSIKQDDNGQNHLLSFSFGSIPWSLGPVNDNIFADPLVDVTSMNVYHNERTSARSYFTEFNAPFNQSLLSSWDKPALMTEIGLFEAGRTTNANGDDIPLGDPNDISSCSDITFHNYMWSTAFSGGYATGLNWWQWFNNGYREQNYPSIANFFLTIDFETNSYVNPGRWDSGILPNSTDAMLETVSLRSENNQHAIGWAHNMTYWWGNIDESCPDRYGNVLPLADNFDDVDWSDPQATMDFPVIEGLTFGRYNIECYNTRGQGGVIGAPTMAWTDIFGRLMIPSPGMLLGGVADYAVKVDADPLFNLRLSNLITLDTLFICTDSICIQGIVDSLYSHTWYINDNPYSNVSDPTIHFPTSGYFDMRHEWADSTGTILTVEQVVNVNNCVSNGSRRNLSTLNDAGIASPDICIGPNPTNWKTTIKAMNGGELLLDVKVFDSNGNEVFRCCDIMSNSFDLFMQNWSTGIYMIVVESTTNRYCKRVIKIE